MPRKDILDAIRKYTEPFRVTKGKDFRLKDFDPGDTQGLKMDKAEAAELLQRGSDWLAMEQDMLYAQDSWSVLLVFQAMDAAGKDGTIKHVMSRVNPQGCEVHSFKPPSPRNFPRLPVALRDQGPAARPDRRLQPLLLRGGAGRAGPPELLKAQRLPRGSSARRFWDERLDDIDAVRGHLARNGVVILKFYLNLSPRRAEKRSWSGSTSRTRTGSSPPPISRSAATGTTT